MAVKASALLSTDWVQFPYDLYLVSLWGHSKGLYYENGVKSCLAQCNKNSVKKRRQVYS